MDRDYASGTADNITFFAGVEIEATHIGHDLSWGTSSFTRTVLVREDAADEEITI
mgnify:CR=1 FL=1